MRLSILASLAALSVCWLPAGCSSEESGSASNSVFPHDSGVLGQAGSAGGGAAGTAGHHSDAGASGGTDSGTPVVDGGSTKDTCGNGLDDDGNGKVDEDCACKAGDTQKCFVGVVTKAGIGACKMGSQSCVTEASQGEFKLNTWGPCTGYGKPSAELCNGADDNCNGLVDDNCSCAPGETKDCSSKCGKGTQTCASGSWTECNAPLPSPEVCGDGVDQDCNGADEPCPSCSDAVQNQDETAVDCGGVCGPSMLFSKWTADACDDGACAEQSQTSFTIANKSVVTNIVTAVGTNGLSGSSFSYTVSQGGIAIVSGDMSLLNCMPGMEWCNFGDGSLHQVLDPGSYELSISWPRMCAKIGSNCEGQLYVQGCPAGP